MKLIKINLLALLLLMGAASISAQVTTIGGSAKFKIGNGEGETKKLTKSFAGGKKIVFDVESTGLYIETHSGNDVIIETNDYEDPPERAKGLKPLYNTAEDNTGIGLQLDIANGLMTIQKASHQDMDYRIKVPASISIEIEEKGWDGGDFKLKGVKGEIEIKAKGSDIVIEDASGPVVANTTSGDITINFVTINQNKPSSISNTSGFIDVSLPSNTKANLVLKSITGEIYTDFDISFSEKEGHNMRRVGGSNLRGSINGGGVEIALNTISDDIYLRKK